MQEEIIKMVEFLFLIINVNDPASIDPLRGRGGCFRDFFLTLACSIRRCGIIHLPLVEDEPNKQSENEIHRGLILW